MSFFLSVFFLSLFLADSLEREGQLHNPGNISLFHFLIIDSRPPGSAPLQDQQYIYTYSFFFRFFSHLGYYKVLGSFLCYMADLCWLSISSKAVCTRQSVYIPNSKSVLRLSSSLWQSEIHSPSLWV